MTTPVRRHVALVALASLTLVASPALASPWTLPERTINLRVGADYQFADREYQLDGDFMPFSLDGRFDSAHLRADVRYGVTDRLEFSASASLDYVNYSADPVYVGDILDASVGEEGSPERVRANLLSLDQTATGLGDLRLALRYRVTPITRAVAAVEVTLKVPTGYEQPRGTFSDDDFAEGVADDVTIGDGQLDADFRFLAGFAPTWDWFIRVDPGFRARTFGGAHQVLGTFKTGYHVVPVWLPYVWVDAQIAVTEGKVIGTSFITDVPETPAREFTVDLLVQQEQRLERSSVQVGGGMIFTLSDRDIDLGYAYTVWGENIAALHQISLSTALTF
jgi:hypothetical protein